MALDNVLSIEASNRVSVRDDYQIGAMLVEEGKLKLSDLDRIIDLHLRGGLRFGEAARRLGLLSDDDLQHVLARQYGMPQLLDGNGEHSASQELIAAYQPHHARTEELRELRTQLLLRWLDPSAGRRVLAITSPNRGDGRSYLAANLAVVFSQLGIRTLLIDADLRNPRQHQIFNIPDRVGLSAVLAGRADLSAIVPVPGCAKLSLLPTGAPPPNPQELLSRPFLAELLGDLGLKYDLVLIDTSAATTCSDSKSVAFRAGSALVLTRKDHTRVIDTSSMVRELHDTGTRIVGMVINAF